MIERLRVHEKRDFAMKSRKFYSYSGKRLHSASTRYTISAFFASKS